MAAPETQHHEHASPPGISGVFREVNERIRDLAERDRTNGVWDFLCECDDLNCSEPISMSLAEYDARVAAGSDALLLAAGPGSGSKHRVVVEPTESGLETPASGPALKQVTSDSARSSTPS
jgi:hypothetical protein